MDTNEIGARIRELRKGRHETIYNLADLCKVSHAAVSSWENGHYRPGREAVLLIANHYGVDPAFIEFGVSGESHFITRKSEAVATTGVAMYRLKGSAGTGVPEYEATTDEPLVFKDSWLKSRGIDPARAACFKVYGDSMEPYLQDGDTILVDCADTDVRDGEAYALRIDGELRIKRLRRSLDGLQLISDNPKYPPESVPATKADLVTVIGRVRWRAG